LLLLLLLPSRNIDWPFTEVNWSYTFRAFNWFPLWLHVERRRFWSISLGLITWSWCQRCWLFLENFRLLSWSFVNGKGRILHLLSSLHRWIEIENLCWLPIFQLTTCRMYYLIIWLEPQIRLALIFVVVMQSVACPGPCSSKIRGTCCHQPFVGLVKWCQYYSVKGTTWWFAWKRGLRRCSLPRCRRLHLSSCPRGKVSASEIRRRSWAFLNWWLILL